MSTYDININNKNDMIRIIENTNNINYIGAYNLYEYISERVYKYKYNIVNIDINTKIENNNYLYNVVISNNYYNMKATIDNLQGKENINISNIIDLNTDKLCSDDLLMFQDIYHCIKDDLLQKLIEYKAECSFNYEINTYDYDD